MKVIIVAGVTDGASGAARPRRLDENAEILIGEADRIFVREPDCPA
jgi:hypothetical protein